MPDDNKTVTLNLSCELSAVELDETHRALALGVDTLAQHKATTKEIVKIRKDDEDKLNGQVLALTASCVTGTTIKPVECVWVLEENPKKVWEAVLYRTDLRDAEGQLSTSVQRRAATADEVKDRRQGRLFQLPPLQAADMTPNLKAAIGPYKPETDEDPDGVPAD